MGKCCKGVGPTENYHKESTSFAFLESVNTVLMKN